MLTITAKFDEAGIFGIIAEGHTGFADKGNDIVCASISSLLQALWLGLEEVLKVEKLETASDPDIPRMSLFWDSGVEQAQLLAKTIFLSIRTIADDYPGYIKIDEVFEQ